MDKEKLNLEDKLTEREVNILMKYGCTENWRHSILDNVLECTHDLEKPMKSSEEFNVVNDIVEKSDELLPREINL